MLLFDHQGKAMSGANPTPLITPRQHPHSEAWWWQDHAVGMFLIGRDWETAKNWRNDGWAKYREILEGNLFQSSRDLRLGWMFTFQQEDDPKHTAKATIKSFKGKHLNVLEWPSQSPDHNSIETLWYDLKIAVHQRNPSNLKVLV